MSSSPLPLAPFELLMWLDHRPDYPMVFPIIGELTGTVNRELAQQAFDIVLSRHPLLTANVDVIRGRPHWIVPAKCENKIVWRDASRIQQRSLDLRAEPGLHVEFCRGPDRWLMAWHFHHSCCDGVSAVSTFAEWLSVYHALVQGSDWQTAIPMLDGRTLAQRGRLRQRTNLRVAGDQKRLWERVRGIWSKSRTAWRVLTTRPDVLAARGGTPTSSAAVVHVCHLDPEKSKTLRANARRLEATVNDFMLTALLLTMSHWNRGNVANFPPQTFRLTMPTNQRVPDDRTLSAANVLSYAMLDRMIHDQSDAATLLASIRDETRAISRYNLSQQFLTSLVLGERWPKLMRLFLGRQSCWASAVLSNLGELGRRVRRQFDWDGDRVIAGDLRLEAAYGVPPIRHGTRISVGTSVYRDRIALTTLMDPRYFDENDQQEFLERFVAELMGLGVRDEG